MRNFFNLKESQAKQLVKNRLRNRHSRRLQRAKVIKSCQIESERLANSSALADSLAALVKNKQ
jgi:hypothetical protein